VDRREEVVHDAEHPVAVGLVAGQHANAQEIEDLLEGAALRAHLPIDRIEVLGPPDHLRLDPELRQARFHGTHHRLHQALALLALQGHALTEIVVRGGIQVLEAEIVELPLDLPDAEPVGQRRIDLARLASDGLRAGGIERGEGSHVVEAVGQLDQDDAEVLRHGEEHLPEVLGLLLLRAVEVEPADLGHAVDQRGHFLAEPALDRGEVAIGVLDDVMEEGGLDQRLVHAGAEEVDQDGRGRDRVRDEGLARAPLLHAVRAGGEVVGLADGRFVVGPSCLGERAEERSQIFGRDRIHGQRT
jgi:hypothetical protein